MNVQDGWYFSGEIEHVGRKRVEWLDLWCRIKLRFFSGCNKWFQFKVIFFPTHSRIKQSDYCYGSPSMAWVITRTPILPANRGRFKLFYDIWRYTHFLSTIVALFNGKCRCSGGRNNFHGDDETDFYEMTLLLPTIRSVGCLHPSRPQIMRL